MKRPSFQFYPADWLRDTGLRSCSTGARGLWIDMICFMHEGNPYGHLKVGDKVILPENLSRMVGETLEVVNVWLNELKVAGVYDVAEDGSICSRRMIRDENLREIRALGGKKGGNPALISKTKVNLEDNLTPNLRLTSSSSSSSSSSVRKKTPLTPQGELPRPDFGDESLQSAWDSFIEYRRQTKKPLTKIAAQKTIAVLRKSFDEGYCPTEMINKTIAAGWQGVFAAKPGDVKTQQSRQGGRFVC